ncbi:unnamed protein product, partial [Callosobruchus maculatus]
MYPFELFMSVFFHASSFFHLLSALALRMLSHTSWPHRRTSSSSPPSPTTTSRCFLGDSEEGESGIAVATVSGSLASLELAVRGYEAGHGTTDAVCAGACAGYSAATTDPLASRTSDDDEDDETAAVDKHRRLLNDQWRQFFDKYDPEGFGEIPWPDFLEAMSDPEFRERVNTGKREILLEKYRTANTAAITFQDFVNVV